MGSDAPSISDTVPETSGGTTAARAAAASKPRLLQRPVAILLIAALVGFGSFFGLRMLSRSWAYESTDDAFTEGHIIPIAPRVAGQIQAVHVKENQTVKKGDVLVEIDPRDYVIAHKQKEAAIANAQTSRETAKAGMVLVEARRKTALASRDQAKAEADSAEANSTRAAADFERAQELRQRKVISPQEFDSAKAAAESTAQNLRAAQEKLAGAESGVAEADAQVEAARTYIDAANVKVTQAELDHNQAELDLERTRIVAPEDGRIARKSAEPGGYVQVGQTLLALVPMRVWVVANFKETQLAKMRAGQAVELRISSSPDRTYRGHVDSFQAGSGARFSLFPPENATGNFVKVVQRVPVKIEIDEPLENFAVIGPGLSVEPEVMVRSPLPEFLVMVAAAGVGIVVFLLLAIRARKTASAAA